MYLLFKPVLRLPIFWMIVAAVVTAASYWLSWVDPPLVAARIQRAVQSGALDGISEKSFAFSLASIIFLVAAGMIVSFGTCHVTPVVLALRGARLRLTKDAPSKASRAQARRAFATNFESVRETLESNRLIGHAWAEFEETLYDTDSEAAIGNTVRPQAFFRTICRT